MSKAFWSQKRYKFASALACQATALALGSAPAMAVTVIDFTGAFAPGNWVFTNILNTNSSNNGTTLTFNGDQSGSSFAYSSYNYTITAPFSGSVTFNWANAVTPSGGGGLNPSVTINFFTRTVSGNSALTAGANTFSIQSGETIGFLGKYRNDGNCCGTTTDQTITSFSASSAAAFSASSAAVPGPLSILGLGATFAYTRKIKKRINDKSNQNLIDFQS